MTKILSTKDVEDRLRGMNLEMKKNLKGVKKGDEVNQSHAYGAVQTLSSVTNQVSPCACERCPLIAYRGWAESPYPLGGEYRRQ